MKRWTQHEPRPAQLVEAQQFNAEMQAARSSMASLDCTQFPLAVLSPATLAPSAVARVYLTELVNGALAYPGQQNTELDTATNAESWAGATYDIYSGGWQTCFVTTLNGHRGGNTIVELIGSGFCNGWDHVVDPASGFVINEKFLSTRIRVNGVTVAEQGGIPHGVQTFRLFGAVQLPPGNHEVAVDWRGVGPTANEPVREYTGNEPILRYHLFNMTFAAYARFR